MPRVAGLRTTSKGAYSRMVLNQSALDQVTLAIADGVFEVGRTIIELAAERAPDSPYEPYPAGEGLPRQGGVLVYVGNKKTHGWSLRGDQPKKPRSIRDVAKRNSVVAAIGFGFPARLDELGTIRQPAQPFLAPTRDEVAPHAVEIIGRVAKPAIARIG